MASTFLYAVERGVLQIAQCWLLNEVLKHFYDLICCSMERLDQGHLHPKLEVLRLTCLGRESNLGPPQCEASLLIL